VSLCKGFRRKVWPWFPWLVFHGFSSATLGNIEASIGLGWSNIDLEFWRIPNNAILLSNWGFVNN
jgi:hypothetical protein